MRRLPVFFLIDVSESMIGKPITNVNDGFKMIINRLRSNPMALETAFLSIIAFAGKPKLLVPLTDILSFNLPTLPIGGGTALGQGMNFLMDEIDKQVIKTTQNIKGDWKPIVFLLTDGVPTDNVSFAVNRWKQNFIKKVNLIAISIGNQADTSILKEFTENVLIFNQTDPNSYSEFFKWISSSIETKSVDVNLGNNEKFTLPELNNEILQNDIKKNKLDERFAILLARCQQTQRPYLLKFVKDSSEKYISEGTYVISEEYFNLSAKSDNTKINTKLLDQNIPACPVCGNNSLAQCVCGKLFCSGNSNLAKCPWCGKEITLEFSADFDISRTQG